MGVVGRRRVAARRRGRHPRRCYPLDSAPPGSTRSPTTTSRRAPTPARSSSAASHPRPDGAVISGSAQVQDALHRLPRAPDPAPRGLYLAVPGRPDRPVRRARRAGTTSSSSTRPRQGLPSVEREVGDGLDLRRAGSTPGLRLPDRAGRARRRSTVGGHTFEGCARWVTTIPIESRGSDRAIEETVEEWTCPGYGPVRSVDRYDPTDS